MKTNRASVLTLPLRPVIAGLLLAFATAPAWAGLGALRVLSGPDEAFYAEIPVEPEPGLSAPSALLAPLERYAMLGPYSAGAAQLQMKTREISPGRYMISVSGPQLARDENFHFALELSWSSGRVVREYQIPADSRLPHGGDKKAPAPLALPAERPTAISGGDGLAFGDGRLLSARGLPLRAEFELLGDWPALQEITKQFSLSQTEGLPGEEQHRFDVTQRGGRLWLRLGGTRPVRAAQIAFSLQAQLDGSSVVRHFSFAVPRAGRHYQRRIAAQAAHGYLVRDGDTLGRLAQRHAPQAVQAWMDEVFRRNPQAFAHGDRNHLFAGAWLLLPDGARRAEAAPVAAADVTPPAATAAPASAPAAAAPHAAPVTASAPQAAVHATASAPAEDVLIKKRLQEAQQRMQWLEAEIARLSARPPAAVPNAAPLSEAESGFLDERLTEWLVGGIGGVSVASLLAWMLLRRRRQAAVKNLPFMTVMPDVTVSMDLAASERPLPQPVAADINIDAIDVFAEADVLMAYGRFDAAETLLRDALHAEPAREDLRLKLLDLVARKGNKGEFEEMALDVLAIFGPQSTMWGRVQQLGDGLDPDNPLYHGDEGARSIPQQLTHPPVDSLPLPDGQWLDDKAPLSVNDFAANDQTTVSLAQALPDTAPVEELARLYREMGDSETADTLLREAGLLQTAQESVEIS